MAYRYSYARAGEDLGQDAVITCEFAAAVNLDVIVFKHDDK